MGIRYVYEPGQGERRSPRALHFTLIALGALAATLALGAILVQAGAPACTSGSAAQNCGTGQAVLVDVAGDTQAGTPAGEIPASDILRVGTQSDANNVYFYLKMDSNNGNAAPSPPVGTPPAATSSANSVAYNVAFSTGNNVCKSVAPVWRSTGWTTNNVFTGACGVGGAGPTAMTFVPSWICNEVKITISWTEMGMTPPASGTVYTGVAHYTADLNQAHWTFDSSGTNTMTIGQNGFIQQSAPNTLSAAAMGDNKIRLTWTQGDIGVQPVTIYNVYRSTTGSGGPFTLLTTVAAGTLTYDDTGLTSGTAYSYKVSNVNCPQLPAITSAPPAGEPAYTGGESLRTSAASVTPDFKPAVPTAFVVGTDTATTLKLTWTPSAFDCPTFGADCPSAGSGATPSGVKGYAIYRAVSPAAPVWVKNVASDNTVCPAAGCSFIDNNAGPGLVTGTLYCYQIRSYDGYTLSSPWTPPTSEPSTLTPKPPNTSALTTPQQCKAPAGAASAPTCSASPATVTTNQNTVVTGAAGDGSFSWSGGGSPATQASGTGTFTTQWPGAGTFTITVTSASQTGTCTVTVTLPLVPNCSASPTSVITGQNTVFTGGGGTGTYSWSGGGTPATQTAGTGTFTTQYSTAGTKTVTVTSNAQTGTCTVTVSLPGPPTCSALPANVVIGQNTVATGASGNGVYAWTGGGTPASQGAGTGTFTTSYSTLGTKTITVTSAAQTATCQVVVKPNHPPTSRFTANPMTVPVGSPVTFVDSSNDTDAGDFINGWAWTFGDGTTFNKASTTHVYGAVGSYQACLVAADKFNAKGNLFCRTISVVAPSGPANGGGNSGSGSSGGSSSGGSSNGGSSSGGSSNGGSNPPPPALSVEAGATLHVTSGDAVDLRASVTGSSTASLAWIQTMGPHVTLTGADGATARFTAPATTTPLDLYFEVQANDGSRHATDGVMVSVQSGNEAPIAKAAPATHVQVGDLVTLDASASNDPDGDVLAFHWTQWKGPATALTSPSSAIVRVTPTEPGTYLFSVDVSDAFATASAQQVVVVDAPDIQALLGPDSGFVLTMAADGTVTVTPTVDADSFLWDFGDGQIVSSPSGTTHQYAAAGHYTIKMTPRVAGTALDSSSQPATVSEAAARPQTLATQASEGPSWLLPVAIGVSTVAIGVAMTFLLRRRPQAKPAPADV
ncbi:MAG: PKD domain-containing protein [bacterium]